MAAFVIGQMKIHNRDWMEKYFAEVPELIDRHGGKFVVRGGDPSLLEGSEPSPDAVFVLTFNSREAASVFWNSPEFAPFIKLRQTGSSLQATLVDGLI